MTRGANVVSCKEGIAFSGGIRELVSKLGKLAFWKVKNRRERSYHRRGASERDNHKRNSEKKGREKQRGSSKKKEGRGNRKERLTQSGCPALTRRRP